MIDAPRRWGLTGDLCSVCRAYPPPDVAYCKPGREWVCWIDDVVGEASDPGVAGDLRDDRGDVTQLNCVHQSPCEHGAHDAFMAEVLTDAQFAAGIHGCHAR